MSRTLREAQLTTKNARARLPAGLHWRGLDRDVHLGYRKGKRGGMWLVRWRSGKGYRQAPLGTADDSMKTSTLDYAAAAKAAREYVEKARLSAAAEAEGPVLTVRRAVELYMAERDARESRREGRAVRSNASQRLHRYVVGQGERGRIAAMPAAHVANIALYELTERDLQAWRDGLPDELKASTKKRLVNDFKAALNAAAATNRIKLPAALPGTIKYGLKVPDGEDDEPVARDNQILSDGQVAQLIAAVGAVDAEHGEDGDLYRLVLTLAATGARFSQVVRLRVSDCQIAAGRLMLPVSRKGRGKTGSIPVPIGRDVMDALVSVATGRAPDAPLLERWHYKRGAGRAWERDARGPWRNRDDLNKGLWPAVRDRAQMSDVIPYALRHSSIVRGIRAGLPLRLVAALPDASTTMVEQHYAKWITSGLEEMVRAAIVPLAPAEEGRVVQLGTTR